MIPIVGRLLLVVVTLAMKIAADLVVLGIRKLVGAIRRRRTKKRMASWHEEHGGLPDEILETFHAEEEKRPMALDLGTRTSTNTVVGSPILGVVYVNLIQMLPYPDLVAALTTPEAVVLATAFFAWLVARFSRTPAQPGTL